MIVKWSVVLLMMSAFTFCKSTDHNDQNELNGEYVYTGSGNPYLPLWEHLPDGEPRVFEDPDNPGKYRIYIIGSHDVQTMRYCGVDTRVWSAPVEDLSQWRDEGAVFTFEDEGNWDIMYAPDLVELKRKDGTKEYYLYPHSRGRGRIAMVAKSDRPDGPFEPINVAEDGKDLEPGSILGFDPAVYVEYITDEKDPDFEIGFRVYGYWGFQHSQAGELDQNTMYSLRPGTEVLDYFIPAGKRYGELRDPEGTTYPHVYEGEDLRRFNFFEAASIRKIGNKYVWVYSGYSGPEYGLSSTNSALRYAYGDSPLGPWKSGGVLVDSRAPVLSKDGSELQTTYSGHNTHGSLEQINGQWYAFYHRAPRSFGYARQSMVAPVTIEWDEALVADGGELRIRAYDPYAKDELWTAKAGNGVEYKGAEVTSEGFHIYGLDPYNYYSAGYACYLSNMGSQADSWDIWDNNMPLVNVKNEDIIGYKYFGFGGLAKDSKGIKAFAGTKEGNNTVFDLFLTPKTNQSFKVNVWLDGPWDNEAWNGKCLGTIVVPAQAEKVKTKYSLDVSDIVDHLDGKHAIFLTIEGKGYSEQCDIIGLGFSSKDKQVECPVVPQVSISVDGKAVELPQYPLRANTTNGILGYDIYEVECKVAANRTPRVTASSDHKDVKVSVQQAELGLAVVKFDYHGVVKTYRVKLISE